MHTGALRDISEHFRRFSSLAKNVCRFYVLEMRFGSHFDMSPKHRRSGWFLARRVIIPQEHIPREAQPGSSPLQRLAVIPGHPCRRLARQFLRMPLQFAEIVERVGTAQLAGVDRLM
jgi:hypothetical protein